ncbi:MAG: DUF2723 domain-containing protein [Bacteroidales bacterium]|nr:DUF2723 domain-containing protein [Bacteroidales bacterium]MBN2697620.1 DUF2723 domain-containing protein [Bacteroidales bacterium]
MDAYRKLNLITGWLSFAIALTVYFLTLEPTVSLWDCGEFIASSYKLQVGHPPGAPLFMLIGRVFSLFASDTGQVAKMINAVSALASAFTILFLFWTITHLLRKIYIKSDTDLKTENLLIIFGSGFVGAMALTFSDTFWFSAVEGEVYATSSLFTALVFWAILKWENVADEPHANRWLILIAYLIGLSIGVHLLNLLAIPAIVLVYYFRKYEVTGKGVVYAIVISAVILLLIMYGVIPGLIRVATWFENFFTNRVGLHFNTGLVIYVTLLTGAVIFGIYFTQFRKENSLWNTVLVSLMVIMIGYSSYAVIVIRSLASPPMNENRPENVYALLSYLNREQYGDRPLMRGHLYNATIKNVEYKKPVYTLDKENNRYEIAYRKPELVFEGNKVLLPRMYSRESSHKQAYSEFGTIKDIDHPTYADNLEFLFRYQIGHMYLRYFMWNFVGRQNDTQGHGNILEGNWLSGINFIDEARLGNQRNLPERMRNHPSRNTYYFLPLIIGLIGLFFHLDRSVKDFWVIMSLFILTGIAIVIYLNQTPYQPRERDYAYAGSFYAFAVWIGFGVAGIYNLIKSFIPPRVAASLAFLVALFGAPVLMGAQNWDDHDRSGRYTARDFARNYLNSCKEDAILYTVGDNDTFPLWYVQDVEGVRPDVRIVNMMLFNTDWYIEQMKWKNYESEPLPISLPFSKYRDGINNSIYVRENERWATVNYIISWIKSEDPRTKLSLRTGERVDYIPTHKIIIPVDTLKVVENGTVSPRFADRVVNEIRLVLTPNDQIMKGNIAQLDIFANNYWERPIYFTSGGFDGSLGLENYYQLEGLAYRVVPIRSEYNRYIDISPIDTDILYDNLMNKFQWGRMNEPDVLLDYYTIRTFSVIRFRSIYTRLALALLEEGEKEKAIEVLDRCMELAPDHVLPYDRYISGITIPLNQQESIHLDGVIEAYYKCGEMEKANAVLREYYQILVEEANYYNTLKPRLRENVQRELYEAIAQIEDMGVLLQQYGQRDLMLELGIE